MWKYPLSYYKSYNGRYFEIYGISSADTEFSGKYCALDDIAKVIYEKPFGFNYLGEPVYHYHSYPDSHHME